MKVSQALRYFMIFTISVLFLNGCTSTSSDGFFSSASTSTDESSSAVKYNSADSASAQKVLEQAREMTTERKLDLLVAEWQAVKSDINRVIELESELGFIVNELTKQDSLSSLYDPNIQLTEYTPQSMPEAEQDKVIENDADFMAAVEKLTQNPIVGKANPLMDKPKVQLIDNKFSNQSSQIMPIDKQLSSNSSKVGYQNSSHSDIDNKFSGNDTLQNSISGANKASIVGPLPSATSSYSTNLKATSDAHEKCELSSQNSKIGVHLISLKDEAKVSKAASELLEKFSTQLCSTFRVNNVVVKGENYFSVRFGPYMSKQDAQEACLSIRSQGQYCGLAEFVGQLM